MPLKNTILNVASSLAAPPPTRFLAFSGGGTNSHSLLSGIFAGALDRLETLGAKSGLADLMGNVKGIGANSGGAWFLTHLAYSKNFFDQFDSIQDRNNYTTTGYIGEFDRIIQGKPGLFDVADSEYTRNPAFAFALFLADFSKGQFEKVPLLSELLDLGGQASYVARVASSILFQSGADWDKFVKSYIYAPLGINSELRDKTLSGSRLSWAADKDLSLVTALTTRNAIVRSDNDLLPGLRDRIYSRAEENVAPRLSAPGVETTWRGAPAVRPLDLLSVAQPGQTYSGIADAPGPKSIIKLTFSNDKFFGPDSLERIFPARLDASGLNVMDATVASSSALAMAPMLDLSLPWWARAVTKLGSPILRNTVKGGEFLLKRTLDGMREFAPLASLKDGKFSMPGGLRVIENFGEQFRKSADDGEIRLLDGGYVDNTGAVGILRRAQQSGTGTPFDLTLIYNSSESLNNDNCFLRVAVGETADGKAALSDYKIQREVAQLFGISTNAVGTKTNPAMRPPGSGVDGPFPGSVDDDAPSPQVFGAEAWRGVTAPEWSFSDVKQVPLSPEEFAKRGSVETRFFDLKVRTVSNPEFGILGGQEGRVRLFLSNNPKSFAVPLWSIEETSRNYNTAREGISLGGGDMELFSAMGLFPMISVAADGQANAKRQLEITGGDKDSSLKGGNFNDIFYGGAGDDSVDGGAGADTMIGGRGDDIYVIDRREDVVVEKPAEGGDRLRSFISVSLAQYPNVEDVFLAGTAAIDATGNEAPNQLFGNDNANSLRGGGGDDYLTGFNGADSLNGEAGNDSVYGGGGADRMSGGAGDDIYEVDNPGDLVLESAGEGTDSVDSDVTHSLAANVENLGLLGNAAINGTGNAQDNRIEGNTGPNSLSGLGGDDFIDGNLGNDTLAGCASGAGSASEIDTLIGGAGLGGGADVFQLGFENGRFYDDGDKATAGRGSYAFIADFTAGTDKLQLHGDESEYFLGPSGINSLEGTGLFHDSNANAKLDGTDELIAVIKSANGTRLDASNTIKTAQFRGGFAFAGDLLKGMDGFLDGYVPKLGFKGLLRSSAESEGRNVPMLGSLSETSGASENDTGDGWLYGALAKFQRGVKDTVARLGAALDQLTLGDFAAELSKSLRNLGLDFGGIGSPNSLDFRGGKDEVLLDLVLRPLNLRPTLGISKDFGLGGLIDAKNALKGRVTSGLQTNLTFGVDKQGFFVSAGKPGAPEFKIGIEATLSQPGAPPVSFEAQVFKFLNYKVADKAEDPSKLSAGFAMDLVEGGDKPDGKIRAGEFKDASLKTSWEGKLDLNLGLKTDIGSLNAPSIKADLNVDWDLQTGGLPTIGLTNAKLEVGPFVKGVARQVLGNLSSMIDGVKRVTNTLTKPISILNAVGLKDMSLLDIAYAFGKINAAGYRFVKAVSAAAGFASKIRDLANSGDLDLGDFALQNPFTGLDPDPKKGQNPLLNIKPAAGAEKLIAGLSDAVGFINAGLSSATTPPPQNKAAGDFIKAYAGFEGGGVSFPIIEQPRTAIKFLFGQDVDLFVWDLPKLKMGFSIMAPPIPVLGPICVTGGVRIEAGAQMGIGLDTSGLRKYLAFPGEDKPEGLILQGLYLRNYDGNEVYAGAGIEVKGGVELGIASAWIGAGIYGQVGLDLRDPIKSPGEAFARVHRWEMGGAPLFRFRGKIEAGAFAELTIGIGPFKKEWRWERRITLIEFGESDNNPEKPKDIIDGNGNIFKAAGDGADRIPSESVDNPDQIQIVGVDGTIQVYAGIFSQTLSDLTTWDKVPSVKAELLAGDDRFSARGDKDGNFLGKAKNFLVDGGAGDDRVETGAGSDTLIGGAGRDKLLGGAGSDTLIGGEGDDELEGGSGNDTLQGDVTGLDGENSGFAMDATVSGQGTLFGTRIARVTPAAIVLSAPLDASVVAGSVLSLTIGARPEALFLNTGQLDYSQSLASAKNLFGSMAVIKAGTKMITGFSGNAVSGITKGMTVVHPSFPDGTKVLSVDGANQITVSAEATADAKDQKIEFYDQKPILFPVAAEKRNATVTLGSQLVGVASTTGLSKGMLVFGPGIPGNTTIAAIESPTQLRLSSPAQANAATLSILLSGNDVLKGGDGADKVFGGDGSDVLEGGVGNDELRGGGGSDELSGDGGDDSLIGGLGGDFLFGGDGRNTLWGGSPDGQSESSDDRQFDPNIYDDVFDASKGVNTIYGGRTDLSDAGFDVVSYRNAETAKTLEVLADSVEFGATVRDISSLKQWLDKDPVGADKDQTDYLATAKLAVVNRILYALDAPYDYDSDTGGELAKLKNLLNLDRPQNERGVLVNLGPNEDRLTLEDGTVLTGFLGTPKKENGFYNLQVRGAGNWFIYEAKKIAESAVVKVDEANPAAAFGGAAAGDRLFGIEQLEGTDFDDTLVGNGSDNVLIGNYGRDSILGGSGHDFIEGGAGADFIDGDGAGSTEATFDEVENLLQAVRPLFPAGSSPADTLPKLNRYLQNPPDVSAAEDMRLYVAVVDKLKEATELPESPMRVQLQIWEESPPVYVWRDAVDYRDSSPASAAAGIGITIDLQAGTASGGDAEGDTLRNVEDVIGSGFSDRITGNEVGNLLRGGSGNDTISGGRGGDTLDGGRGQDSLLGGLGNDVYLLDERGDIIFDEAGRDSVRTNISFTLPAGIEDLELVEPPGPRDYDVEDWRKRGATSENVTIVEGGDPSQPLRPLELADIDEQGRPYDPVALLARRNLLLAKAAASALSTLSLTLAQRAQLVKANLIDVESLGLQPAQRKELEDQLLKTGNSADPALTARTKDLLGAAERAELADAERILGAVLFAAVGTGNETRNVLIGNLHDNTLSGLGGPDKLIGQDGNDWLDGGVGSDEMDGGKGNDTYIVDEASDVVIELQKIVRDAPVYETFGGLSYRVGTTQEIVDGGKDTVLVRMPGPQMKFDLSRSTASDVEIVKVDNAMPVEIIGNRLNNSLVGGMLADTLRGGGTNADDNDYLDGGRGVDWFYGGAGNDTYVIDDIREQMTITEGRDEGTKDVVMSYVSLDLSRDGSGSITNFEDLVLLEAYDKNGRIKAVVGKGTDGNNLVKGNSANNILTGFAGDDTLAGEGGNDTLLPGKGNNDSIDGGAGIDTVDYSGFASAIVADLAFRTATIAAEKKTDRLSLIENLLAGAGNDSLLGSLADNFLSGGQGNDTLVGGDGRDSLSGGAGNDSLMAGKASDSSRYEFIDLPYPWTLAKILAENSYRNLKALRPQIKTHLATIGSEAEWQFMLSQTGVHDGWLGATDTEKEGSWKWIDGTDLSFYPDGWSFDNSSLTKLVVEHSYVREIRPGVITLGSLFERQTELLPLYETRDEDFLSTSGRSWQDLYPDNWTNALNAPPYSTGHSFGQAGLFNVYKDVERTTSFNRRGYFLEIEGLPALAAATLDGGSGNDVLIGGEGNDFLDGGTGLDTMTGGGGSDTYVLDDPRELPGIYANELTGAFAQPDEIRSTVSVDLSAMPSKGVFEGLERVQLLGSGDLFAKLGANTIYGQLVGNAGRNSLFAGNYEAILDGGAGNDVLVGGAGNDVYFVTSENWLSRDQVIEPEKGGYDVVVSESGSVFNMGGGQLGLEALAQQPVADNLPPGSFVEGFGTDGNNLMISGGNAYLYGSSFGSDTLVGGGGRESLEGGVDKDVLISGTDFSATRFALVHGHFTWEEAKADAERRGGHLATIGSFAEQSRLEKILSPYFRRASQTANSFAATTSLLNRFPWLGARKSAADGSWQWVDGTSWGFENWATALPLSDPRRDDYLAMRLLGGSSVVADIFKWSSSTNSEVSYVIEFDKPLEGFATLRGGGGDDTYTIRSLGDVVVEISAGSDRIIYDPLGPDPRAAQQYKLPDNVESFSYAGNLGLNILVGDVTSGVSVATGSGDDMLEAGQGTDSRFVTLRGGAGSDTYDADNLSAFDHATIVESEFDFGIDVLKTSVGVPSFFDLPAGIENLVLTGDGNLPGRGNNLSNFIVGNKGANTLDGAGGNDTLDGGAGADSLDGGSGDDSLVGGTGADTMDGGSGNDVFYVDDPGDVVVENDASFDTVVSGVSWTLGEFLENLELAGNVAIDGTGNDLPNQLTGNAAANDLRGLDGDDTLDGGAGKDTLRGGLGDDVYYVDDLNDVIDEKDGEGNNDLVISTVSDYVLPAFVENIAFRPNGTGSIRFTKGFTPNMLGGSDASELLDGGPGADIMIGGRGADTYIVDNANDIVAESVDMATESGQSFMAMMGGMELSSMLTETDGARDMVRASVAFALPNLFEDLVLEGAATVGTGNALNNRLIGNAAGNTLVGNGGNDTLNGMQGRDWMVGGFGSDVYVLDVNTDVVVETADRRVSPADKVEAPFSLDLSAGMLAKVEHLALLGTGNFTGKGNSADNFLTGNAGNNTLWGLDGDDRLAPGAGADMLVGGLGSDTYFVDSPGDTVVETDNAVSSPAKPVTRGGIQTGFRDIQWLGQKFVATVSCADHGFEVGQQVRFAGSPLPAFDGREYEVLAVEPGKFMVEVSPGTGSDAATAGRTVQRVDNLLTDLVVSSVDFALPDNVENLSLTGGSALSGTGNELDNSISGNAGANVLDGNLGLDTLAGGAGDDTYTVDQFVDQVVESAGEGNDLVNSKASFMLPDNVENLTLLDRQETDGTAGAGESAFGNVLSNYLKGNSRDNLLDGTTGVRAEVDASGNLVAGFVGNDTLDGGKGADTMRGARGSNLYIVDDARDAVEEIWPEAEVDVVRSSVDFVLGERLENLVLTGNAPINGTGNALANTITGNAAANKLAGAGGPDLLSGLEGDDTLDGMSGNDTLVGGDGNDLYLLGDAAEKVVELPGEGRDTIRASISYSLAGVENVEDLVLASLAAVVGTGNALSNRLTGNAADNTLAGGAGNDVLDGRQGGDSLAGGAGDDLYYVDEEGDIVAESANAGVDEIESSIDLTLPTNVENLRLAADAFVGAGNALDNRIIGNISRNILSGSLGNDLLFGLDDNDSLTGGVGDDIIDGGAGKDTMVGGVGDDSYAVDDSGDFVWETALAGTDLVVSAITFALPSNVENLVLDGYAAINGTGNQLPNLLAGNDEANVLNGGAGIDTMSGGAGNDTYVVDVAADIVSEAAGGGTDTVQSLVTRTLGAEQEILVLTGAASINGTGNEGNNTLTGNGAANVLAGAGGNDRMLGLGGNDTLGGVFGDDTLVGGSGDDVYLVNNAADVVVELANEGKDTIQIDAAYDLGALPNVENLVLTGSAAINGTGNAAANNLTGNAAANVLTGGLGNDNAVGGGGNDTLTGCANGPGGGRGEIDTLTGGVGNDVFQLGFAKGRFYDDGNAADAGRGDYALITDFTVGQDKLQLDGAAKDYFFGASGVPGVAGAGLFHDSNANAKLDATDELIAVVRSVGNAPLNTAGIGNLAQLV